MAGKPLLQSAIGLLALFALTAVAAVKQPAANISWPEGKRAALSLSFDDARASQVDGAALLDGYNVKATFYVMPAGIERKLAGWKKVVASGHEIANHTVYHPCLGWPRQNALEDYTLERMRQELLEANRRIQELLGVVPETFAFPCAKTFVGRGKEHRSYVPLVADLFVAARVGEGRIPPDPAQIDFMQLSATDLDEKDFVQILPVIEAARKSGSWVILAGHDIGKDGTETTRLAMLEKLLQYARDPANELWIAPVSVIAKYLRAQFKHNGPSK
ncbi:MAG: polysaccharide deacetylase [Betaproteobacteria bacterium]|nr:polysaccharide deacetylase [Betaproteobacteria bacterium]